MATTAPESSFDLGTTLAVILAAMMFTMPGAFLLFAVEAALGERVSSGRTLDGVVLISGAIAGAAMLGLASQEAPVSAALAGGFYGLTTAVVFVCLQRQLGSRRERNS
jgi:hypothetical protein